MRIHNSAGSAGCEPYVLCLQIHIPNIAQALSGVTRSVYPRVSPPLQDYQSEYAPDPLHTDLADDLRAFAAQEEYADLPRRGPGPTPPPPHRHPIRGTGQYGFPLSRRRGPRAHLQHFVNQILTHGLHALHSCAPPPPSGGVLDSPNKRAKVFFIDCTNESGLWDTLNPSR